MKGRVLPLYFDPGRDRDFDTVLKALRSLLADQVDFLEPRPLGAELPSSEAVLFPQLLGEAYRRVEDFRGIDVPILLVTTEFGTLSMWDWEIATYLRSHGIQTIGPYKLQQTQAVCAALAAKRELAQGTFLVYQDDPGEGFQAPIFKRFYWWEDECTQRLKDTFGVTIVKKSFRELGARAKAIADSDADAVARDWGSPPRGLTEQALRSAVKLYLALTHDLDAHPDVLAAGINCLNESHFSDTTPCLAWSRLYQERGLIWGCEADTLAMISKLILHRSLGAPILMTNLYPFVLGDAALRHEHIERFPAVDSEPDNHILVAHCGYMGVIPRAFASKWALRGKVLDIVDDNASAIDARIAPGPITLAKLHPSMDRISATEGELTGYAQFPNSHCLNGGVIRIADGHRMMESLVSHHYLLLSGHHSLNIDFVSKVFGFEKTCN